MSRNGEGSIGRKVDRRGKRFRDVGLGLGRDQAQDEPEGGLKTLITRNPVEALANPEQSGRGDSGHRSRGVSRGRDLLHQRPPFPCPREHSDALMTHVVPEER